MHSIIRSHRTTSSNTARRAPRALTGTAGLATAIALLAGCSSSSPSTTPAAGSSASVGGSTSVGGSAADGAGTQSLDGVTVSSAIDLTKKPVVKSSSTKAPSIIEVKDLITGTGAAASPSSTVKVQYVGVRYADGFQFDASWDHGGAISFSLAQVVPGFTQGIGGTDGIAPMKIGGRRLMILPAALGYGAQGTSDGSIPPNAPIVFVVDLVGVG
jgi:peptidylprolyl isomerase